MEIRNFECEDSRATGASSVQSIPSGVRVHSRETDTVIHAFMPTTHQTLTISVSDIHDVT